MMKFPAGCQELKNVKVPGWIPEDNFQLLIKKTIEYNKIIKLEDKINKKLFTNDEGRSIKFCPAESSELVPLSSLCDAFDNLECEGSVMNTQGSGSRYSGTGAGGNFWGERQGGGGVGTFAGGNINREKQQHLLDQEVPDSILREEQLYRK